VDTNVLIRIATGDLPDVALRLVKDIATFPKASIWLGEAVFAEAVFVLSSPKQYGLSRAAIRSIGQEILATRQFACEREVLQAAIDAYAATKLDFVDCLLLSQKRCGKVSQLFTLDSELKKISI